MNYEIAFPHLNIFIEKLPNSFTIFNFEIAFYGILIAIAMLVGFYVATKLSKKSYIKEDIMYDLFIIVVISAIIGARIYYVIFNIDDYIKNPIEILNLRAGGLGVYGGIILSLISVFVYSKIKKVSFFNITDTCIAGLCIGQIIGRFGNFFNKEAFGTYTDNLLAMRLKYDDVSSSVIDLNLIINSIVDNGIRYIQVHPTFLYEALCNLFLFIILIYVFNNRRRFFGQITFIYMFFYGICRFFIEGLRTDSLYIINTDIRISQLVSIIFIILAIVLYIKFGMSKKFQIDIDKLKEEYELSILKDKEKEEKKKQNKEDYIVSNENIVDDKNVDSNIDDNKNIDD